MVNYTEKQIRHWEKWPAKRDHKLSYMLKHGVLLWSLPTFALMFLIEKDSYSLLTWNLWDWYVGITVWGVAGLVAGHFMYKRQEKGYKLFIESRM